MPGGGELFDTQALASEPAMADPARMSLHLLQEDTPAGALAVLQQTQTELNEYWRAQRQTFDIPLAPQGSAFQQKIWQALLAVPCGATLSYGQLGEQAGLGTGHGRAVGTAVGSNPISIIIPCHRILAHNHSLNGYGGGLGRKIRLLQLEGLVIG
ncbi:methylated-DNA--[protein]-cysteine S-methyltransferase [Castellaniella sp.]|uniref:methylated-DNA--[protein]-cysteine S-methyltransferase n=1 Tax=Castellaniella sp. TaxID=1955812 RepID=UPI002AFDFEF6|nr:methylated-DNA--[protein]-cysteine S-methyltransferase [Castellaniella sp.]